MLIDTKLRAMETSSKVREDAFDEKMKEADQKLANM